MTLAFIDPNWAIPANTTLLIVLAGINAWRTKRVAKRVDFVSQQAADAKKKVGATRREEDRTFDAQIKESFPTHNPANRRFTDRPVDAE